MLKIKNNSHATGKEMKLYLNSLYSVIFVFIYFITLLFYTGSVPLWFNRFPYASGFRFLIALGTYSLCGSLFFSIRAILLRSSETVLYWCMFFLSFIPVPVLSCLVIRNLPLQSLQIFLKITDMLPITASFPKEKILFNQKNESYFSNRNFLYGYSDKSHYNIFLFYNFRIQSCAYPPFRTGSQCFFGGTDITGDKE